MAELVMCAVVALFELFLTGSIGMNGVVGPSIRRCRSSGAPVNTSCYVNVLAAIFVLLQLTMLKLSFQVLLFEFQNLLLHAFFVLLMMLVHSLRRF